MTSFQFTESTQSRKVDFRPPGIKDTCQTSCRIWGVLSTGCVPLICLHGGPGCPSPCLEVFQLLHQRYNIPVIVYDQLGCGESTHLREKKGDISFWTIELFHAELENLISAFGIAQYDLFGHSWGGVLVADFAIKQPKGLRKLIICSSPACTAERVKTTERQMAELPPEMQAALKKGKESGDTQNAEYKMADEEIFKRHLFRGTTMPPPLGKALAVMGEDDTVSYSLYGPSPLALTGPMKDYDARPNLHRITISTAPGGVLLMNGKFDSSPDEVMTPFFAKIQAKVKWVRFASSSHMPFWEETDDFFEALGDFLQSS